MSRFRSVIARVAMALATFGAGGAGLAFVAQPAYASVPDNGGCMSPSNSSIPDTMACEWTGPSWLVNALNNGQPVPISVGQTFTATFTMTNVSSQTVPALSGWTPASDYFSISNLVIPSVAIAPGNTISASVTFHIKSAPYAQGTFAPVGNSTEGFYPGFPVTLAPAPTPVPTTPAINQAVSLAADGNNGYWITTSYGGVINLGQGVPWYGSPAAQTQGHVPSPVVGIASYGTTGYYVVTARGNVFNYGNAPWLGSLAGATLPAPVVGMAVTQNGYVLTTSKGNVYNFGTPWYGSEGGTTLPSPVVGIASFGNGYWLATSGGNVYQFGSAAWMGSPLAAGDNVSSGVVAVASSGRGYLVTTANNHTYAFAANAGGSYVQANSPTVGVANDPYGGYWTLSQSGAIYSQSPATYHGGAN